MAAADNDVARLDAAIAALSAQRALLGDAAVDLAVATLRAQIAALRGDADAHALRQVSVLFTDVVGSTALTGRLDPEDAGALLDDALARFSKLVLAHDGRVMQYAGDSLLAVFGAPVARDDDAARAVAAGLAIAAEGRVIAAEVAARHGLAGFDVRVGVHTGGVLLGGGIDGEHSVRGAAVAIAARMEQSAPPGRVRISQDTYRLVRGRFRMEAQPPLLIKGRDEPMLTHLVVGEIAALQAERGVEGVRAPMVGRQAQLQQLQQALLAMTGPAPLCALAVIGDAGLGKSRLADEFRRWAQQRPQAPLWLQAHGSPQRQSRPYGMLHQLLAAALDLRDSDPAPQARQRWLAAVAPHLPGRDDATVLGHVLGLDFSDDPELQLLAGQPRQLRDRAFFHATQLLRGLAPDGVPRVVLLEDMHWCDDGTLDFVETLLAEHHELPLLLLVLLRPSLFERRPAWARDGSPWLPVRLEPLDEQGSRELADALCARLAEPSPLLHELITSRAEGNPFCMEELLNMLIDQRAVVVDQEAWRFDPSRLRAETLPTTLVGVLQARLDALPADERRTSQLASVVGYRFWDDSLRALGAPLPQGLDGLVQREVALHQPSSLEGLHEFAFRHHTLHQVAYESLLRRQRRELHARVARWLAALPGITAFDMVAEHHERGGEPELACHHWQRAAEHAAQRFANRDALAHAARALALSDPDDLNRRWTLLLLRCRLLDLLAEREAQGAEVELLLEVAARLDNPARRSEALAHRARLLYACGDASAALAVARDAVLLAPADAPQPAAIAQAQVAQCLLRLGRHAEAAQEQVAALALARRAGDLGKEGIILNDMGMRASVQGDHGAAIGLFLQALQCHRQAGQRNNEGGTLGNLGYAALMLGDYASATERLEQARTIFARIGQRQNEGITLTNLGIARLQRGQADQALAHAEMALGLLRSARDRWAEAAALRVAGQALLALGNTPAANERLQASCCLFEALDLPHLAVEARASLAEVALADGDVAAALQQVEPILQRLDGGLGLDGTEEPMRVRLTCHRVLAAAADPRAATQLDEAHRLLMVQAQAISDPALRRNHLQEVPYHRDIVAAWQQQLSRRS